MKMAYALLRKGRIFMQSYSKATTGLWVASGPVYIVAVDAPENLDSIIRRALDGSKEGVQHPSQNEWKAVQAPMLEAAGVKSWTALSKGAKAVGLHSENGIVKMTPSLNYENKGGTSNLEAVVERELKNFDLGSALVEAFEACR
ncbi:conserved protein of unknown function [Pararobbsia alpina]|uniref:hypothetical protein n=1 Tax=Pararobbsia alpina TaxID=621374 RepID=UPI0039A729A7